MNLAKDAFIILFCLAGSDGVLDERERQIIIDFLNLQSVALGQMNFAPQEAVSEIASLDLAGRNEMLNRALLNLKDHSSPEIHLAMIDAASAIAAADGVISDGERILFQTMAAIWEIDLQEFLRQRGVSVAPTANVANTEMNRACYRAWLLGSAYSAYLSKVPLLGSSLCQADFEAAKGVADVMGLTIKPLQGLDSVGLPASFGEIIAGNFFNEESQNLVGQMDGRYGSKKVSSYFLIIAKCHLTLERLADAHEAELILNEILRLSVHTEIPDESIEELVSTVRQGARNFAAFEDSVTEFLYNRQ